MRTLLNTCALVLAFCLCGCSDDDGVTAPELKVLSTTAKFDASGGEGKIEVQSPVAITAVSEEAWCTVSVSGQTVNVTVPVNETITGRTAMVAITAGDETLKVPVYQAGGIFICNLRSVNFPIGGGSRTFSLKTVGVRDVSVEAPEWLKYEIRDEEIVFTADPADNDRFARVTVTNRGSSVTAVFRQFSVEGTYSVSFVDQTNMPKTGTAVVTKSSSGNTYDVKTQGMPLNAIIKASYSEETSQMVIPFGQDLGQAETMDNNTYTVKLCAVASDGYVSWSPDIQYVADAEFNETGKVKFEFKDNGTWPGKQVIGLCYGAFNSGGDFAEIDFGLAINLVMTKQ